jgi:hypothetical protein
VRAALTVILVVAALSLVACDDDGAGDAEQFCTSVAENVDALRANPVTAVAVEDLIDLWRDVGDDAPLAIEEEWNTHADNLELAWSGDDQQDVLASTFAAERSAVAIAAWLEDNCAIEWGPVTTIVPGTVPAASLPGASSTSTTSTTQPSG